MRNFIITPKQPKKCPSVLRIGVLQALDDYFHHLDGQEPMDLYSLVVEEVEAILLEVAFKYTAGNQTRAANILGLSRVTLRKKLQQYQIT